MLLCDAGVLLAAGNVKGHHRAACIALMRAAKGPLLVPTPVLGEIGYLLQLRVGPHAEVTFLKSFGGNGPTPGWNSPPSRVNERYIRRSG